MASNIGDTSAGGALKFIEVNARYKLDRDVVLPLGTRTDLQECLARLRFHQKIYVEWNFGSVDPNGMTAILNFYGPPGTGKTMAAEALAGTLGLPFLSLGISEIESKFMGETAKNIQAAFAQARESGALLFFDEADTLLGKRLSSVTQGVDNEVNAMRSTMLIELERHEGVVVFATNFAKNYDEAFRSRISYHVRFDLPDLESRRVLWRRMMVDEIPTAEDKATLSDRCAEISDGLSGRDIRNCMRLALPKPLVDLVDAGDPNLHFDHLRDAVNQVKLAAADVGTAPSAARERAAAADAAVTKRLLGI